MRIFATMLLLILATAEAVAQEPDTTVISRAMTPFLVAAGIAYITRRRAIGGWLFFYYLSLYVGSALMAIMAWTTELPYLAQEGWEPFYWRMAALDYMLLLLTNFVVLVFGVRLQFKANRNEKGLMLMRYALVVALVSSIASMFIGMQFFPEDEGGNVLGVMGVCASAIWCAYWFMSRRVKYVMTLGEREWNYDDWKGVPLHER